MCGTESLYMFDPCLLALAEHPYTRFRADKKRGVVKPIYTALQKHVGRTSLCKALKEP